MTVLSFPSRHLPALTIAAVRGQSVYIVPVRRIDHASLSPAPQEAAE